MNYKIKRFDDMGRLVIPAEYREILKVGPRDAMKVELKDNTLVITPHDKRIRCAVTGSSYNLKKYAGSVYLSPEGAEILKDELDKNK